VGEAVADALGLEDGVPLVVGVREQRIQAALTTVGPGVAEPADYSRAPRIAIAGMRKEARLTCCLVRRTLAIDRLWQGDPRFQPLVSRLVVLLEVENQPVRGGQIPN
jgi:hypothetical protein